MVRRFPAGAVDLTGDVPDARIGKNGSDFCARESGFAADIPNGLAKDRILLILNGCGSDPPDVR